MKQVIIIGAGPAGLTAACELLRRSSDYQVLILEESDTVGGISRTVRHNGCRMDIGGHRFFSKDASVTAWWESILPMQGALPLDDRLLGRTTPTVENGPDPETEDHVMLVRNRISRIFYRHKFFDYPISMKPQTFKNMGLVSTVKAGASYMKSAVSKKEETSLENFYINRFGKVLYSMFFEGYTEKLWGRHPREISADWGAQRVKGLSIRAILKDMIGKLKPGKSNRPVETSLIEEFSYPKFGPGQLWETVAEEIVSRGGEIRYGCCVTGVPSEGNRVTGVTVVRDGQTETLPADIVISSMPLKDLTAGMDNVPQEVADVAEGLPYRDFVTVGLLVDRLCLRNETPIKTLGNIVPDCWIYVQDTGVKLGRIQIFNNWSPYMLPDPDKQVWIGLEYFCREGDEFWSMDEQKCVDFAVRELVSMGVLDESIAVKDSHRERVKKAYPAYFDTYAQIDTLTDWLNGFDNLYCVGRNGQHRYNNMDHSMVTAFETVNNILGGVTDKSNIWNVNTEKEYHEQKSEENNQ